MRYRVFLMLVANSVAAQAAALAARSGGPERRVRALQVEPKRTFIEPHLLPYVADVSIVRASLLPPSRRIAVHLQLFSEEDPSRAEEQILHLRSNVLWPVARIRTAGGFVQVNLLADKHGRVRREYRVETEGGSQLVAGHHGVIVDRTITAGNSVELHGRTFHQGGTGRAFAAIVGRRDLGYTLDLGKLAGHWLRLEVMGERILGFSAVSEA